DRRPSTIDLKAVDLKTGKRTMRRVGLLCPFCVLFEHGCPEYTYVMLRFLRRRPYRWAAVTVAAVTAFLMGTASTALAATGTVNPAGSPLTVRAGPGTGYDAWSSVADGTTVTILCQTPGSSVTGTYGTSTIWDMLTNGGFVSDAYVNTGSDGYV